MDNNLRVVYETIYPKCPDCYWSQRLHIQQLGFIAENPPLDDELVGLITDDDPQNCRYCIRMNKLAHSCGRNLTKVIQWNQTKN